MAELKDRVSSKPGRFLIKPESGTGDFYATLEMADSPRVHGTKLSRQNVIDTLLPLSQNGGVGTVIFTAVGRVDDRWQECDGSRVRSEEYTELYGLLPDVPLRTAGMTVSETGSTAAVKGPARYINGYYIVCLDGKIAWTKDLGGTWNISSVSDSVSDIAYGNGYWVIVTYSSSKGTVRYATSLDGTWTVGKGATETLYKGRVLFIDGKFYAFGRYPSATVTYMFTATTPSDWTSVRIERKHLYPENVVYSKKRGRWECLAVDTETIDSVKHTKRQLYASEDLLNWSAVSEQFDDIELMGANLDDLGCYLGIDEEYINVYGKPGIIGIKADGSEAVVTTYPVELKNSSLVAVCDGETEMILGGDDSSSYAASGKAELVRQQATGEFIQSPWFAFDEKVATTVPSYMIERQPDGNFLLTRVGAVYAFDSIYQRYCPEIAVPDDTGLVRAYIKTK